MDISSEDFRDVLRHFPAGVTIVTILDPDDGSRHGLTVSAFASISPMPPLIMVAIDHRGFAHELLQKEGAVFAVNILGEEQMDLSNRFAWLKDQDRFAEGTWTTAETGAPILSESVAWLDCTVSQRHEAGTHTIYVGEVQASGVNRPEAAPLIYWNRGYRSLQLTE